MKKKSFCFTKCLITQLVKLKEGKLNNINGGVHSIYGFTCTKFVYRKIN